jgi:hypothetical protein
MSGMPERIWISVKDIVHALQGSSGNTDTDPRWRAAEILKSLDCWESRELPVKTDLITARLEAADKMEMALAMITDLVERVGDSRKDADLIDAANEALQSYRAAKEKVL